MPESAFTSDTTLLAVLRGDWETCWSMLAGQRAQLHQMGGLQNWELGREVTVSTVLLVEPQPLPGAFLVFLWKGIAFSLAQVT